MHNPFVPETLEGWSVLHLMYRIDWGRLREAYPGDRKQMADEAVAALAVDGSEGASAPSLRVTEPCLKPALCVTIRIRAPFFASSAEASAERRGASK